MISNKAEMYRMLHRGDFGNTVPMWFDLRKWAFDVSFAPYHSIQVWGVRTLTPGGPCWLNVPRKHVSYWCDEAERGGHKVNISPMIDRIVNVTMWANVLRSPSGLIVECIEYPDKSSNWRAEMPTKAKAYQNTAANMLLRKHLNPSTLDDLGILLDKYPDAVVELSATESEFGTVPGRNAIIWEVRNY